MTELRRFLISSVYQLVCPISAGSLKDVILGTGADEKTRVCSRTWERYCMAFLFLDVDLEVEAFI